jgi:hypothetical protein
LIEGWYTTGTGDELAIYALMWAKKAIEDEQHRMRQESLGVSS